VIINGVASMRRHFQLVCFFFVDLRVVAGGVVGVTVKVDPVVAERLSCSRLS
jgi:hypothetical protein